MIINSENKIGLVLSGGGVRVIEYQLGAIKALLDNGIKPDFIYACSGGSLTGAVYFSGKDFMEVMKTLQPKNFLKANNYLSVLMGAPVFKIEPVIDAMNRIMGDSVYENMVVNFTDLETHNTYYAKGSKSTVIASMSIPKIFPNKRLTGTVYQNTVPYEYERPSRCVQKLVFINDREVVDGGVYNIIPFPDYDTIKAAKHIFVIHPPANISPEEMERSGHLRQCYNWITEIEERGYRQSLPIYGNMENVSIIRMAPISTPFFDWSKDFKLYNYAYENMSKIIKTDSVIKGLIK